MVDDNEDLAYGLCFGVTVADDEVDLAYGLDAGLAYGLFFVAEKDDDDDGAKDGVVGVAVAVAVALEALL